MKNIIELLMGFQIPLLMYFIGRQPGKEGLSYHG
jgi:hypothetical protein